MLNEIIKESGADEEVQETIKQNFAHELSKIIGRSESELKDLKKNLSYENVEETLTKVIELQKYLGTWEDELNEIIDVETSTDEE